MDLGMDLGDVFAPGDALVDLEAGSKPRLFALLAAHAAAATGVDAAMLRAAVEFREDLGSTGVGNGVALPHAPVEGLVAPWGLVARLATPIPFDAVDRVPVDIVCLVLSPPNSGGRPLVVLSRVARALRSRAAQDRIRAAATPEALRAAFLRSDVQMSNGTESSGDKDIA